MDEKSNTQEHLIAFAKRKKTLIVLTFSFFLVFIVVVTVIMITMGGSNYQSSKMPEEYLDGIQYLRNHMKDPSSFILCGDVFVRDYIRKESGEKVVMVGVRYNANNGYGAKGGIDTGVIMSGEYDWNYYSADSKDKFISLLGGKNGKNTVEIEYESLLEDIKIRERRLEQIKSGRANVDEEAQKRIKDAYEGFLEEKKEYHIYNGKDVAKALNCEYYEYK